MALRIHIGKAANWVFSLSAVSAWIVVLTSGGAVFGAVRRHEGSAFVIVLALFVVAGLAVTTDPRLRDPALPIAEAIGALGGALVAILFGLGLTDETYIKAPSFGQLLFAAGGLIQALVVARVQIAREARTREKRLDQQLDEIMKNQATLLAYFDDLRSQSDEPVHNGATSGRERWRRWLSRGL